MSVTCKVIENYEVYGKCVEISNGTVKAIVTADIGPRILFYGFCDGENVLEQNHSGQANWEGKAWDEYYYEGAKSYIYGGHRIWVTPEGAPETYYPDNEALEVEYTDKGAIFTAPPQIKNDIQVSIEIRMADSGAEMEVYNRVKNVGSCDKEFAVWTISVMQQGGLEIFPQNTNDTGYLHNRVISLWSYTNPNDYRFYNGKKYMTLKQDPGAPCAFKMGTNNRSGVALYCAKETVFIKTREVDHDNLVYPDGNVSFETYTASGVMELEMMDAVKVVAPGVTSEFKENWALKVNPGTPDARSDDEIDAFWKEVMG